MALDTHGQAFTFFGGAPAHMMDDPLKTVVDTICAGRQRRFNRRFVSCESRHRKRFLPLQSAKKSSRQANGLQLGKRESFGRERLEIFARCFTPNAISSAQPPICPARLARIRRSRMRCKQPGSTN